MTLEQLLAQVRASLQAKITERNTHSNIIKQVRAAVEAEKRTELSEDETSRVTAANAARSHIDADIEKLRADEAGYLEEIRGDEAIEALQRELTPAADAPEHTERTVTPTARITSEERTYTAEKNMRGESSFFVDAFRAEYKGDYRAKDRLERHSREVEVEREYTARGEGMEERASNTTSYAGLIVPQYLVDQAALIARAGRPFANTCVSLELPEQGMSLIIPRGTTGASAAIQATENSSVSSTDEVLANLTIPVVTIAGQQDISRQSLERGTPGIDTLVYMDLAGAYGVSLDAQVLSGTGSSGQMLGVLQTSGIGQATAFGAAATATTFYSKVAGQVSGVETLRFLAPTAIAMHPRRWNWLVSQIDSQGRPLVVPNANGPFNAFAAFDSPVDTPASVPVGSLQGLPVVTDASIPTSVGTGPEDQVIVYRREDLLLWENGDGMPRELSFEQTLGNQLTVKLVAYNYAAFTAGRYPTAVGVVGGNAGTAGFGLVAPSF